MTGIFRFVARSAFVLAMACGAGFIWLNVTTVGAASLPPLKTGDIVFQDSGGGQGMAIMLASRSVYTHVGLIELSPDGTPLVVEAVGPVRTVPLDQWIAKGTAHRITVKRIKGLSEPEAKNAVARAHTYDGYPYDIFFHDTRDAIYCSELVHAAYLESSGRVVGRVEKVRDLSIDNSAARTLIEARWQNYPPCKVKGITTFDACFALILDQTLVTPASLARDPQMETIYTNFGVIGD